MLKKNRRRREKKKKNIRDRAFFGILSYRYPVASYARSASATAHKSLPCRESGCCTCSNEAPSRLQGVHEAQLRGLVHVHVIIHDTFLSRKARKHPYTEHAEICTFSLVSRSKQKKRNDGLCSLEKGEEILVVHTGYLLHRLHQPCASQKLAGSGIGRARQQATAQARRFGKRPSFLVGRRTSCSVLSYPRVCLENCSHTNSWHQKTSRATRKNFRKKLELGKAALHWFSYNSFQARPPIENS